MRQMLKRRLEDAGLPQLFSPHGFRVAVVTNLLNRMCLCRTFSTSPGTPTPGPPRFTIAGCRRVTRNIVERISI
jgi:hypothetical protein